MASRTGPHAPPQIRPVVWMQRVIGVFLVATACWNAALGEWAICFAQASSAVVFLVFDAQARLTYRRAWQNGRRELLNSMKEASDRGLSPAEWVIAEIERTEMGQLTITIRQEDE